MHDTLAQPASHTAAAAGFPGSRRQVAIGRILSILAAAFLLFDSAGKLLRVDAVITTTGQLGYPSEAIFGLGLTQLLCLILYIVPTTSAFGALLLTGYLGGAVATHVRVGSPLGTHVLFPIYLAVVLWGGLVLRDPRLAILLPGRRRS